MQPFENPCMITSRQWCVGRVARWDLFLGDVCLTAPSLVQGGAPGRVAASLVSTIADRVLRSHQLPSRHAYAAILAS